MQKHISFRKICLSTIFILWNINNLSAQYLSGPTPVDVGETVTYTYNDSNIKKAFSWSVTGGTLISSSNLGTTYTAEVHWPNIGTHRIEALGRGNLLEGMDVVVEYALPADAVTMHNYIHNITPRVATTDINTLSTTEKVESITYFDGLGRASQSIGIRAGGGSEDIITHIGYDAFGRQKKEYLPYSSLSNIGAFRPDALATTITYYDTSTYEEDFSGMTLADINPYAEKEFDGSPLNRVIKQAAPGKDWKLGNGREIEMEYLTNKTGEVKYYFVKLFRDVTNNVVTYVPSLELNDNYPADELFKTVIKDENHDGTNTKNHTTEEFKNKQGQVVLKRTFNNAIAHDTYYVYDHYGNLSFVLPPKSEPHAARPDPTALSELCYQYVYDDLNRLVEKKIPGKGWEYIVYNKLDLPVMTQDANLRASNQWLVSKYDAFGRVVYTGKKNSSSDRHHFQNLLGSGVVFEQRVTSGTGYLGTYYTSNAYPNTLNEIYTINYYDDYNFNLDGGISEMAYGITPITNAKGLVTGNKVKVLGTDGKWITTVTYYDKKSRSVYVYSKNVYLNTIDKVKSQLTFDGRVTETTTTHLRTGYGNPITIVDKYSYDHANRLIDHRQNINSAVLDEVIAKNRYDNLGQLKRKDVGGKENDIDNLQNIDYSYNIRGWLKAINNTSIIGNDLFAFKLNYNTEDHGGTELFNGNIAETEWKTKNDNVLRWYRYSYDALNRITNGTASSNNYDLEGVNYDRNGNITNLVRKGHTNASGTTFGIMDNLTYTYETKSNKLKKVDDTGNFTYGFKDGAASSVEYTYDANGNMITDANKDITSISYNHLNLPTDVNFVSGNISYVYDATGVKQKKTVSTGTITEYAGNFIYEDHSLKMFSHPEGYTERFQAGKFPTFKYVYQHKDHLGNIRLTYADTDGNGSVNSSTEIIEEDNYYPFGLKHKGYNGRVTANANSVARKFKYNGKEFEESLGYEMYEYEARHYDATIARFITIDPLAEDYAYQSTYTYAANNPIFFIDKFGMGPFGDYFSSKGKYLGSDGIDDGKIYVSQGNKENFLTASNQEVPGGLASLGGIKTSLALTNASSSHRYSPDTKGGLHEVRIDIDLDGVTSFTEGGKVTVDPATNVASGEVNELDVMISGVDTSKSDIVGHSHPTKTIIEGGKAYTFDANSPTAADKADFKNRDVSFISGNIESKTATKTKNSDGTFTFNTPKNKQGAVFYNKNATPIMTISIKTINNILSNYEMGKLKNK